MNHPLQKPVILSAPQGWGKTHLASQLMTALQCAGAVDEWTPGQALTPGMLHLTQCPLQQLSAVADGCILVVVG